MKNLPTLNITLSANKIHASGAKDPVAAVQPPKGGMDPGIAPIEVFNQVIRFKGV